MRRVFVAETFGFSAVGAAHGGENRAQGALLQLIKPIESLCRFPQMGHEVAQAPEPQPVRDMVFGNRIVRFSTHANALVVLPVR